MGWSQFLADIFSKTPEPEPLRKKEHLTNLSGNFSNKQIEYFDNSWHVWP